MIWMKYAKMARLASLVRPAEVAFGMIRYDIDDV